MRALVTLTLLAAGTTLRAQDARTCRAADRELTERGTLRLPAATTGRLLVANQFSSTATVVDLATGVSISLPTGQGPHEAAVSADGAWGVVSNFSPDLGRRYLGNKLFVIDMRTMRLGRTIETGEYRGLHDVAFRPGFATRVLVTAQTSGHVVEVDIATGRIVAATPTEGDRSHMLAVSPDGRTAWTTNEGTADVSRLDLATNRRVARFAASPQVEGIAVTANGRELWVGEGSRGLVRVLDAESGAELARFTGFRTPHRMALSRDGTRLVISDPQCRNLVVADPVARRLRHTLRTPFDPPVMVGEIAPDNRVAFAAVSKHRAVIVLDLDSGQVLARHGVGRHPDGVAWGPAGTR